MRQALASIALFLLVFFTHAHSGVSSSFDSRWTIPVAQSLLRSGDSDLNEYGAEIRKIRKFGVRRKNGNWYNFFPLGPSLVALPFVAAVEAFPLPAVWLFPRLQSGTASDGSPVVDAVERHLILEQIIASFLTALTTVLLFYMGTYLTSAGLSFFAALVFAFCTPAWSTASRALWQHGPSMLCLSTALLLLVRGRARRHAGAPSGFFLGSAYLMRPTNSIAVLVLSLYKLISHPREFIRYMTWLLIPLGAFALYNLAVYERFLPSYFRPKRLIMSVDFFQAIAANLLSPSRGLLIFSPVLLIALLAILQKLTARTGNRLEYALLVTVALHLITISLFPGWWGGHSYGPRFMSDILPFLHYFFVIGLSQIADAARPFRLWVVTGVLTLFSFFVHFRGATDPGVYLWNTLPVNIDSDPGRVWDWRDPQFLRGCCSGNSRRRPGLDQQ